MGCGASVPAKPDELPAGAGAEAPANETLGSAKKSEPEPEPEQVLLSCRARMGLPEWFSPKQEDEVAAANKMAKDHYLGLQTAFHEGHDVWPGHHHERYAFERTNRARDRPLSVSATRLDKAAVSQRNWIGSCFGDKPSPVCRCHPLTLSLSLSLPLAFALALVCSQQRRWPPGRRSPSCARSGGSVGGRRRNHRAELRRADVHSRENAG